MRFTIDASKPWKVVGVTYGAVMGQFATEAAALAYCRELAGMGSLPMRVEYRV